MELVLCVDEVFYDGSVFTWSLIRLVYDILCIEICKHIWTYWNANKYGFECWYQYRVFVWLLVLQTDKTMWFPELNML